MKDLEGKIFGRWTVGPIHLKLHDKIKWYCTCECGNTSNVLAGNLTTGKSTGCFKCKKHYEKHGKCKHRLYSTWKSMKNRCQNKNNKNYKHYGNRGISINKDWEDFECFLSDMEESFKEGLTLERMDNSLGYCKNNCKWATKIEQGNNQRTNLKLIYQGSIITEAELSRITGVKRTTLQTRRKKGASVEEMINGFK